MKRNNKLLLIITILLFIPSTIYANCTKEELAKFNRIEDGYKITYEFKNETKLYTLKVYSPKPELYDFANNKLFSNCSEIDSTTVECTNVKPGEYELDIVGLTDTCNGTLKKVKLSLPKYNKYSENSMCRGIEEFVLCQPTYDKDIDYETFVSRVQTYKKSLENKQEEITPEEKTKPKVTESNKIIEYLKENLIQVIIIGVFIIMVIITIILTAKSIKKSRRLE